MNHSRILCAIAHIELHFYPIIFKVSIWTENNFTLLQAVGRKRNAKLGGLSPYQNHFFHTVKYKQLLHFSWHLSTVGGIHNKVSMLSWMLVVLFHNLKIHLFLYYMHRLKIRYVLFLDEIRFSFAKIYFPQIKVE